MCYGISFATFLFFDETVFITQKKKEPADKNGSKILE